MAYSRTTDQRPTTNLSEVEDLGIPSLATRAVPDELGDVALTIRLEVDANLVRSIEPMNGSDLSIRRSEVLNESASGVMPSLRFVVRQLSEGILLTLRINTKSRRMASLEPSDGGDTSRGGSHVIEGTMLPRSRHGGFVELQVGLLVVNAERRRVGVGRRRDGGAGEGSGQGRPVGPSLAPDDLVNDAILLLIINANLRLIAPPDGGETGDRGDVGSGESRSLGPATAVDVLLDVILLVEVVDADLGSRGVPGDGGERGAESGLEKLLGVVPASADIVVQSAFVDPPIGVLMIHTEVKTYDTSLVEGRINKDYHTVVQPLDSCDTSAFDVGHDDFLSKLREVEVIRQMS